MTRSAAEIGAGLRPVRAARPIEPGERIHVIGAAGAGASAAALLAHAAGAVVSGCDAGGPSPYAVAVEAAGIPMAWQHAPEHVEAPPHPHRLAVTKAMTAVAPNEPELVAAARLGIPAEPWQQVVADAAVGRTLVAIAGTHGKSTTAGWLAHVLAAGGGDPSAFVGALLPASLTGGLPATARIGTGGAFVVEADEYAGNFDAYRPAIAVLTSIEWDHPDVFADRTAVVDALEAWLRRAALIDGPALGSAAGSRSSRAPALVANIDDPGVVELLERLGDWPAEIVATTLDAPAGTGNPNPELDVARAGDRVIRARVVSEDPAGTTIELHGLDGAGDRVARLPTAGRHNVANALGVAGAALLLGLGGGAIAAGLETFEGIGRRLERKGESHGVVVYDDYAHHPSAIRETLRAVRQREPGRRLWAVYEPLTFHRTAALLDDFADVLSTADGVAIADIWPGRDTDRTVTSPGALVDAILRRRGGSGAASNGASVGARPDRAAAITPAPVAAPGSVEETAAWLAERVQPGDAVLVMGGGHSYRIGELLLAQLEAGQERN